MISRAVKKKDLDESDLEAYDIFCDDRVACGVGFAWAVF